MTPRCHGWWAAEVPGADHGSDYEFLVDDDERGYPDPRSAWQPHGVHAASRVLDHSRFEWTDSGWDAPPLGTAVIYEMHLGTFTPEGTCIAAIERLDYLAWLGITHVQVMPVASFPGRHGWGYDGVALYAPHTAYGEPDDLKRFVDACHARGIAVLLDVVYNHFGPSGNYTGKFAPYLNVAHSTPWGAAVNFEAAGSDEVRRFFCDNALMWLRDYHFDGLRLDAVHAFVDRSAVHFLEQLSAEVDDLPSRTGRRLVLIAESDLNDPRVVTSRDAGGYGMDAQWSDDFHHALFSLLSAETTCYYADFGSIAHLAKSLITPFVYDGQYSQYRERSHGRPVSGLSGNRFLGYIQNHDQVGNRAAGERLHHVTSVAIAKIAAALVLTSPYVPMIFQGEEFAASTPFQYFADHDEPQLAKAVSEGRRREFLAFGWSPSEVPDPEDPATFERSKLIWREAENGAHREMLQWYRQLIHLRRNSPELHDGDLTRVVVRFDEEARWLEMERGAFVIICNFCTEPIRRSVPPRSRMILSSDDQTIVAHGTVSMGPQSVVIVDRENR